MKKFFSFFYMIIAVIVLAFAYFTGFFNPKNLMSSVNAESEIMHTVNFYGSDNETVIYSVDVPKGKSLQDIQNSNVISADESCFYSYNEISRSNGVESGYFLRGQTSFNPTLKLLTLNNRFSVWGYSLANLSRFSSVSGLTAFSFDLFMDFDYSSYPIHYSIQGYKEDGTNESLILRYILNNGLVSDSYLIDFSLYKYIEFRVVSYGYAESTPYPFNCNIDYFNIQIGSNYDYFSEYYIQQLVGGVKNWSSSLEYFKKFDFNEPINSDLDLYFDVERNFSEKEIALDVVSKNNVISNTSLNSVKNLHVQGDLKREVNITNLTSSNFLTASLSSSATTTIKTLNYFSIDIIESTTFNSINLVFESDIPFSVISNSNTFSISADENTTFKLSIGVSGFPDTSQQIFQSIETFNFTSNLTNFEDFLNVFASNNYKFITNHNFAEIPFNYFQGFQNNQAEDLNLNGSLTLTLRYFENGSLKNQNYNVSSVHTKTTGFSFEVPLISASGVRVLFESYEFVNGSTFVLNTESNLILNNIDSVFYTLIDYESNLEYNLTFDNSENSQDSNYLLFYNSDLNKKDYQLTTFLIDFNENFEFNVNNLTSNSFDLNIPFTINSIYYRPPLNTSKELDKFNFKVPEYLSTDIEFSLSPLKLDIPFSNYIYNFIIYLLFYAPLLSDVVYLIYLVIQTLMKCFNLVISFFVGVSSNFFIVILLGFIILNFVLKFTLGGRDD